MGSINLDIFTNEEIESAIDDPKKFIQAAYHYSLWEDARIERLKYYEKYIDTIPEVKEHCRTIAEEIQKLRKKHIAVDRMLMDFLLGHKGYKLILKHHFQGQALYKVLEEECWTLRWAQELEARALKIFSQCLAEEYDKRRTCSKN